MKVARILPTLPCEWLAMAAPSVRIRAAQIDLATRGDSLAAGDTRSALQAHRDALGGAIARQFPAKAA